MAEASWPFYNVETNEVQFSKWARVLGYSGIATGLAVTPGAGMQVSVAPGSALVRGVYYENDAAATLAVGAAPGSGTRRDALILRLDQTANSIVLAVKAGTVGALPALTQNETIWEMLLAEIAVPSGAASITTGMIISAQPSVGLRVVPYATTQRPTPSASEVMIGIDLTTDRLELWDGAGWSDLVSVATLQGILPISKGGTGASSVKAAREALGIFVQPTDPGSPTAGKVWIPGTAMP